MWFILLLLLPGVQAKGSSGWDDFTDNLATDLAPLITLFGERLTKQFLSESISVLDNFIFALAPLGILTAVVSVIRVCGNPSLRAFVGRAQEGPGEAERELLSCVSETTAEVFNDGGVSRVFGRPQILEVVVWEDQSPKEERRSLQMGTLRDALHEGAWYREGYQGEQADEQEYPPALDIPNLSLNTGIKRRRQGWFYVAACLGCVLQVGVVFYSALTVFLYPANFKKDDKPVAEYAFPLFLLGTILLCTGMFLCAFIIERSSRECYLRPNKPSKIYWLQPGGQHVGDQVFGPFLDANEGRHSEATTDIRYIKSTRHQRLKVNDLWLLSTVSLTIAGWVIQFVGLRGLHASVVLAQMGSTILMAIIRTWLRTKRIGSDDSQFTQEECRLTAHKKQELDCFAFRLEDVESFNICTNFADELSQVPSDISSSTTAIESDASVGPGIRLLHTRARLAELTSDAGQCENKAWHDLPIRNIAHSLADTIGRTMDLLSSVGVMKSGSGHFTLVLKCSQGVASPTLETLTIKPQRSENTLRWRVNKIELEAVLGLWTWSLLRSNEDWLQPRLGRLIGLHESEAKAEEKNLYFHKWIFRRRKAEMVSSHMISSSRQLFGFYSNTYPGHVDTLVVRTENGLETMAAQDIYIHFLYSVLKGVEKHQDEVKVQFSHQSGFSAYSGFIDELVDCFVSGNLGSREDGLLCIVPALRRRNLLPDLAADSTSVLQHVDDSIARGNWQYAFLLVRWLCERCEGPEFERSAFELGRLCHRAMLHNDPNIQKQGYHECTMVLQSHSRADYLRRLDRPQIAGLVNSRKQREWWRAFSMQLGWVAWHIANSHPSTAPMKATLESAGAAECLAYENTSQVDAEEAVCALLRCLLFVGEGPFPWAMSLTSFVEEHDDQASFDWVARNGLTALCHWLSMKWADVAKQTPHLAQRAFLYAARSQSDSAIEILCHRGLDINTCLYGTTHYTALVQLVECNNTEAAVKTIAHGGDIHGYSHLYTAPIFVAAAVNGNQQLMELLLAHGIDIECEDGFEFTALRRACAGSDIKTVSFLLGKGANIDAIGQDGTPLMHAAQADFHHMAEFLINHGANINAQDSSGATALIIAAHIRAANAVRVLLDKKADVNIRDSSNESALAKARWRGFREISALLAEHHPHDEHEHHVKIYPPVPIPSPPGK